MLRHVAVFRWVDGTTPEQVQRATDELRALPALIPEIRGFTCGPDAGGAPEHWDYAVVADFDDLAGYGVYATHPEHLRVIRDAIVPIRGTRGFLQLEV